MSDDAIYFRWTGGQATFIDAPSVEVWGDVVIGRYGGASSSGAKQNDDGAYVLGSSQGGGWRFASVLDAHYSDESAALVLATLEERRGRLIEALALPPSAAFEQLRVLLVGSFTSEAFLEACARVKGECSALFVAQKDRFAWWLSVGDCLAFVLHEDLARLEQFAVNQRQFFQWLGRSNSFGLEAPAFSTGVQELRRGRNTLVLVTDGVFEYDGSPYAYPQRVYDAIGPDRRDLESGVRGMIQNVHAGGGRDSATLIAWRVLIDDEATLASAPRGRGRA